jgi:hypothetical protein
MHAELVMEDFELENKRVKPEDVRAALIYLVPGSSTKALSFAKSASTVCK